MRAFLAIPQADPYPWRAVSEGLAACGVEAARDVPPTQGFDLLVTWSPWEGSHRADLARAFTAQGKPVWVMENGFLSPINGEPYYQLALNGWNGTGQFPAGDGSRWASWGLALAPWAERPRRALVAGQRGLPGDARTCAPGWERTVDVDCPQALRRPRDTPWPLADDLAVVDRCHVWTSNAATDAIMAGVPVIQHGPNLMVSELASRPGEPLRRPDRLPVLERLAWSQWNRAELASGEPFRRLLA